MRGRDSSGSGRITGCKSADGVVVTNQYAAWPKLRQQVLDFSQEVLRRLREVNDDHRYPRRQLLHSSLP